MRISIYIFSLLILISCKSQYGYDSIGHFTDYIEENSKPLFATVVKHSDGSIPKLSEGEQKYFVWKTVKYNYKVSRIESFSTYKTLRNIDIENMSPEEVEHVKNSNHLYNNYLFFIDDYRCIYISEDDNRDQESYGNVPMYFKKRGYKLDKKVYGSAMKQFTRGYYHLHGSELFIDFGGIKHFYIKANFDGTSIVFDSIHIPEKKTLNSSGINNIYVPFVGMLNDIAQPIFELPDEDDAIPEPNMILVSGLRSKEIRKDRINPLDSILRANYPQWKSAQADKIIKITYDSTILKRTYEIEIMNLIGGVPRFDTIEVTEDLENIATW